MTKLGNALLALCLATALALPATLARAAALPEFGPSVQFDPSGPQPTVAKLKGKAVIVLFFQSGDKNSNAWSGKLIAAMQESFGTNQTVVLLALKTDGGGVAAAKGYLSSKGANTDQWVVGTDADAKYSTDLVGDPLWYYVLVGADGTIVERGKAGVTHNVVLGPDKKQREQRYNLADPKIVKACGKLATALPAGKSYPSSVKSLARLAELGDAEKALAACALLLPKPKEKQAAAELIADLQPLVEKRIADRSAILGDASGASSARYEAFNELALMAKDLKNHPLAAKISPLLIRARQDPALQKEARAESAYKTLQPRVLKATDRDKPRLAKELESFAKLHAGTKYGQLAAETAEQFAASAPADAK